MTAHAENAGAMGSVMRPRVIELRVSRGGHSAMASAIASGPRWISDNTSLRWLGYWRD